MVWSKGRVSRSRRGALLLLSGCLLPCPVAAQGAPDPSSALDTAMGTAEAALKAGNPQLAAGRYRAAMSQGWVLMGELDLADGRLAPARDDFQAASDLAGEDPRVLHALALAHRYMGENDEAVKILTRISEKDPTDRALRSELAEALMGSGRTEEAVRLLEQSHKAAPDDLQVAFSLGAGYLKLKKLSSAEPLFAQLSSARPIAATHVLIGHAYGDVGEYASAREEFGLALKLDPKVRKAHYYLGIAARAATEGADGLEKAVSEFRAELALTPNDPLASLQLGMALMEFPRPQEALPFLKRASELDPPDPRALYSLGRCQLALGLFADAESTLTRGLELTEKAGPGPNGAPQDRAVRAQLGALHNQLGQAEARLGKTEEAAKNFDLARELADEAVVETLEAQRQYYLREADAQQTVAVTPQPQDSPLARLPKDARSGMRTRATAALARAYLNVGLINLQGERFPEAAELFEKAAALDPEFPEVQYALGVARFNAKQFDKATDPLGRAALKDPTNIPLRRMLAMAFLNAKVYDRAAELLERDPDVGKDPSLQFAYATALSNSGRLSEATAIFQELVLRHQDSADLNVVMGEAYAKDGDFDAAVESAKRAIALNPSVKGANAILGGIYLEQGKLPEAEKAYRAELKVQPDDVSFKHDLALVLEAAQQPAEAIVLLRSVLLSDPDYADAHYLLGKILLTQGATEEAKDHLETALRLKPKDANVHYQLGRVYQKLGRVDEAQQQFEVFRQMKAARQ